MAGEELVNKIIQIQTKFQELKHKIQYVDERIDSLMEEIQIRNHCQIEEIEKLKRSQEHMKKVYKDRVVNLLQGLPLSNSLDDIEGTLTKFEGEENCILRALDELSGFKTRANVEAGEKKKERDFGIGEPCLLPLGVDRQCKEEYHLGKQTYKEEHGPLGRIFKGLDEKELRKEILGLFDEMDQVLSWNPVLLIEKLQDLMNDEELDVPSYERECRFFRKREHDIESGLWFMVAFLMLFITENERHEEEFQQFSAQLRASANKSTKLINKFVNILEGAGQRLREMKNLKRLTMNMSEMFCFSKRFEEGGLRKFLEILLDGMEHLDFILRDVQMPRPSEGLFEGEVLDAVDRCEETFVFVREQMSYFFGPGYDQWEDMVFFYTEGGEE